MIVKNYDKLVTVDLSKATSTRSSLTVNDITRSLPEYESTAPQSTYEECQSDGCDTSPTVIHVLVVLIPIIVLALMVFCFVWTRRVRKREAAKRLQEVEQKTVVEA